MVILRELINRPIIKRSRRCESCGAEFECRIGLKGCWCTEIELTEETRKELSENYKDCLCRTCLGSASIKPPQDNSEKR